MEGDFEIMKALYTEMKNEVEKNPEKISNTSFLWFLKSTRIMIPNDQEFGTEVSKLLIIHEIKKEMKV